MRVQQDSSVKGKELEIRLFPNPNDGRFMINLSEEPEGDVSFAIYDITGKMIQSRRISNSDLQQNVEVDISGFAAGTYIINVTAGNREFSKQFIKK